MASGTSLMQISSLLLCASSHCDSIFYIWAQLLQVCKFIKTLKYQSSNCMVLFSKILNKFYYSENNVNFTPTIKKWMNLRTLWVTSEFKGVSVTWAIENVNSY